MTTQTSSRPATMKVCVKAKVCMYIVNKLDLLATTFWQQTTDTPQPHSGTEFLKVLLKNKDMKVTPFELLKLGLI